MSQDNTGKIVKTDDFWEKHDKEVFNNFIKSHMFFYPKSRKDESDRFSIHMHKKYFGNMSDDEIVEYLLALFEHPVGIYTFDYTDMEYNFFNFYFNFWNGYERDIPEVDDLSEVFPTEEQIP